MQQIDGIIGMDQSTKTTTAQDGPASSIGSASSAPRAADVGSWYMALAHAWGGALDQESGKVINLSQRLTQGGQDTISTVTQLTAESMRLQFLSNSASTSVKSVAQALEALARKQ